MLRFQWLMEESIDSGRAWDALIIGGGPAGSALGGLLAAWGHRVLIVAPARDPARGLVESIPPSARKLLAAVAMLDAVDRALFDANRGNAVWWGTREGRIEDFGVGANGISAFRPDLDRVLLDQAARAGAVIWRDAAVRNVTFDERDPATIEVAHGDERRQPLRARFVADCSGRAGVIARRGHRVHEPTHRMQAFVGTWCRTRGAARDLEGRTLIETYEDGWAWSLPLGVSQRQVAVMVDGSVTRTARGPTIEAAYRAEIAKTMQAQQLVEDATLERAWACDASMHTARAFSGDQFLLVGDAATCIDPLSSSGVKKALSSAWLAAIALHTALVDEGRRRLAFDYFARRERDVYAAELAHTEAYAARAFAHHGHEFWRRRSSQPRGVSETPDIDQLLRSDAVRIAHEQLRAAAHVDLRRALTLTLTPQPIVRGREIVLEDALAIGRSPVRFAGNIDLVTLVDVAPHHREVAAIFDAYCRARGDVPLPHFLAALSLLIAEGLLDRSAASS